MTQPQPHVPTAREQKFLESVEEGRYEREIISGLGPFFHEKAPEDMLNFYSKDEVTSLKVLKGTDRDVESRMPVKITRHYYDLARTSAAIQRIVKADPAETMDLAGSDPMVLINAKIAAWLGALVEAGVESIRIGTKEMAFYPQRFDRTFLSMLDRFHETYPQVGLHMMLHFEHPDEFLAKDAEGNYVEDAQGFKQWVPATHEGMRGLASRGWLSVENQAPIMRGINDDPDALRILQREFKRAGGENHYFFCGRDIIAYKAFNVPIETAWTILNTSQKGLSGVESHARLSITHYKGKTEVAAVTNEAIPGLAGSENGVLIFKILRNAGSAPDRGKVCIVGRNPEALWFDDYEDRVLFDEAGLYDYARVSAAGQAPGRATAPDRATTLQVA